MILLLLLVFSPLLRAAENREVRTYLPFSYPVDPARIHTLPDMRIALALTGTLVEWDDEKELSAGLAESWKIISKSVYRLTLRSNAQWSDGTPILASEVKRSFERSLRIHPVDMRGLSLTLRAIECPSSREIDFRLKVPAQNSGLLRRLAEPKFGIVKIGANDDLNLAVTSGPFSLSPSSNRAELTLIRNPKWMRAQIESPNVDQIVIRKMTRDMDTQSLLLSDKWPNFMQTLSLSSSDYLRKYAENGFELWKAPLDRVFYLQLGQRSSTSDGRSLLRFLRRNLDRQTLLSGMTGYSITSQMFPRGYELHDPSFSCAAKTNELLPVNFKKRPIDILVSPARVSLVLKENLRSILKELTGIEPHFISVPLEEVPKYRSKGDFDLYAGVVGISDPDLDSLISFYLEGDIPLLYPSDTDFQDQLVKAKKTIEEPAKLAKVRALLGKALCEGYILPLFHLSTVAIGSKDLDFSLVSSADESVRFSKIRFRSKAKTLVGGSQ